MAHGPVRTATGRAKVSRVMREGARGALHMGRTGRTVPRNRPDIMRAIGMSEGRRAERKLRRS